MSLLRVRRQSRENSRRLYRFSFTLWVAVAVVALFTPWAYGLSAALFGVFLNLAALDGPLKQSPEEG